MAPAPRKSQADAARIAALRAETAARRKDTPDGGLLSSYMVQTNGGGSLETVAGFGNRRAIVDGFDSVRLPVPPGYGYEAPPPWPAQPMQPVWLGSVPMPTGSILPVELRPPLPRRRARERDRPRRPGDDPRPRHHSLALHLPPRGDLRQRPQGLWHRLVRRPRDGDHRRALRLGPPHRRAGGRDPHHPRPQRQHGALRPVRLPQVRGDERLAETHTRPRRRSHQRPARDEGQVRRGFGEPLGYFGVAAFSDKKLEMLLVNTSGYPVEAAKPFATQWFNGGRIKSAEKDHITYMIDTEGGQSGSPIFFYEKETEERLVVAIHTTGYYPNRGVRITDALLDVIEGWIANPPTGPAAPEEVTPAERAALGGGLSAPRRPRRAAPARRRPPPAPARRPPRAPPAPGRRPCPRSCRSACRRRSSRA